MRRLSKWWGFKFGFGLAAAMIGAGFIDATQGRVGRLIVGFILLMVMSLVPWERED